VRHTALSLISFILKRALKTVDHCLNKEAWQESGVYTAGMMEEFVQHFREALSKVGTGPGLGFPTDLTIHHSREEGLHRGWELKNRSVRLQDGRGWWAVLRHTAKGQLIKLPCTCGLVCV
jgi:hypothetical protein